MTGKGEPLTNEEVRILEPKDVDNSDISIFGEHFYTNCGYFFNAFLPPANEVAGRSCFYRCL